MQANMPVLGDGTTHYYHQGPVFVDDITNETHEQELRWNPNENTNVQEKDMGAVKGTNLKDLCDLVGGMSDGEQVKILSSDGWSRWFAYKNVYDYSSREGPIGICWYKGGTYPDTGYSDGMRMVWFADTSTNPWGIHAFGNFNWHEAAAPEYWYYYQSGTENYPTTTGISGQNVNRIFIYSNQVPPVTNVTSKMGIFRPTSGIWSLDSNGNDAWDVSDTSLSWGLPNDKPVIGDWNGDGKDDIGIFRPSSGIWSLDSNGNDAWDVSDTSLSWGLPDDIPVIGDWNGDGKDDIGIFRPSSESGALTRMGMMHGMFQTRV